jgi:hypothetical protein
MEEELIIRRLINGWTLRKWNDETEVWLEECFEAPCDGATDIDPKYFKMRVEKVKELLYTVLEELGEFYGKHQPYYIEIKVRKNPDYALWNDQSTAPTS